jgi:hypothetical protein
MVDDPRLPRLPRFLINMYLPAASQSEIAVELARHIRAEFDLRFRRTNAPARRKPMPVTALAS